MPTKPTNIDEYLARVSEPQRKALEKLRRDIRAAAPAAEECISYDIPSYRVGSRLLFHSEPERSIARSTPVLTRSAHTQTS
jgi:uncharacterized protein YdhG (YjbR/CyaY superfamily)